MYSDRFDKFIEWVLLRETVFKKGKYGNYDYAVSQNVKGDRGGLTKFGIDQRSHPNVNINALKKDDAIDIYWNDYWVKWGIERYPLGYGEFVADVRINGGNPIKMIQQGLNNIGENLVVDGIFGPKTLEAMTRRGKKGILAAIDARDQYYKTLAKSSSRAKFLEGWLNRNKHLRAWINENV